MWDRSFGNPAIFIPQRMPILSAFPEKYLSFYETAVFVNFAESTELLVGERVVGHAVKIRSQMLWVGRLRNWNDSVLVCPFQAYFSWMDMSGFCNSPQYWVAEFTYIFFSPVTFRSFGASNRTESNRDYPIVFEVGDEFLLLKVGVEFHLICKWPDSAVGKESFHLWHRHVAGSDVADKTIVDKLFHLVPDHHEFLMDVWTCIGAT